MMVGIKTGLRLESVCSIYGKGCTRSLIGRWDVSMKIYSIETRASGGRVSVLADLKTTRLSNRIFDLVTIAMPYQSKQLVFHAHIFHPIKCAFVIVVIKLCLCDLPTAVFWVCGVCGVAVRDLKASHTSCGDSKLGELQTPTLVTRPLGTGKGRVQLILSLAIPHITPAF